MSHLKREDDDDEEAVDHEEHERHLVSQLQEVTLHARLLILVLLERQQVLPDQFLQHVHTLFINKVAFQSLIIN